MIIHPLRDVWGAYAIRPYTGYVLVRVPGMRHAGVTFDPAASACDMPSSLLIQRPRHATCQRYFRPSGLGMRHASVTFDPAASACDMTASLLTQRPRHATCRRYFRPSGRGMRHASVTFDPAAAACDMPALLSTQRPRHATCQGVRDASQVWPGTCRGRWDAPRQGPF